MGMPPIVEDWPQRLNHLAYARAEEKISAATFPQHMKQVHADSLAAMVEHFLASGPDYRGLSVSRLPGIRVCGCPSYPALGRWRRDAA